MPTLLADGSEEEGYASGYHLSWNAVILWALNLAVFNETPPLMARSGSSFANDEARLRPDGLVAAQPLEIRLATDT